MDIANKTHAKDYLLEYKAKDTTPNWLGLLIQKVIDTDGKPSDTDKDEIFAALVRENELEEATQQEENQEADDSEDQEEQTVPDQEKLVLNKITHNSGVNALIPSQSITFSPSCTIVYGLNGTGKSGYFRIIHELAGGKQRKSILGNIRSQPEDLDVDVEYSLDGEDPIQYKWEDKHDRGVSPFTQIGVFDSEYMPIFLNERESSANIEPLGLHLFHVVTSMVDDFKERLADRQRDLVSTLPDLQPLIDDVNSEELQTLFQQTALDDNDVQLLGQYTAVSKDEKSRLKSLTKKKSELEKTNNEDSRKLWEQEKTDIETLKDDLDGLKESLDDLATRVAETIEDYHKKKEARDERVKEFKVLQNVPSQNSDEWTAFIEAAQDYGVTIDESGAFNREDTCLYCHQPLDEGAVKLVKAYSEYLSDKSQENFKTVVDEMAELAEEVEELTTKFQKSKGLIKILTDKQIGEENNGKSIVDQIESVATSQKSALLKSLKDKKANDKTVVLDLLGIGDVLEKLAEVKQKQIEDSEQSDEKKNEAIAKLQAQIDVLEDKQTVVKWKTKIDGYFSTHAKIQSYEEANSRIITTGITVLGSRAHDELLTDSIRQSFEDELTALGKDVEVTLEKTGAGKGTVRTCIKILGSDVQSILSDGEQKAACLALFLGEVVSQPGENPIVFDDPVTSVDHEVADLFAKRLLQVSQQRQIVVFTHNRLFYDSLIHWSNNLRDGQNVKTHHVCRNYIQGGCSNQGCHVYTYSINRVAKDAIGRVSERQNESCSYFIRKAEQELRGSFSVQSVAGLMKSAIEHFIDEEMLHNQRLLKDRERQISIQWNELKKINVDHDKLDQLKEYWDKLSDRGSHLTQNSAQNPLQEQDFREIIQFLRQ